MERFVRFVVAGGIVMVAGLWLVALLERGSPTWIAGIGLAAAGIAGLARGIERGIRYS